MLLAYATPAFAVQRRSSISGNQAPTTAPFCLRTLPATYPASTSPPVTRVLLLLLVHLLHLFLRALACLRLAPLACLRRPTSAAIGDGLMVAARALLVLVHLFLPQQMNTSAAAAPLRVLVLLLPLSSLSSRAPAIT